MARFLVVALHCALLVACNSGPLPTVGQRSPDGINGLVVEPRPECAAELLQAIKSKDADAVAQRLKNGDPVNCGEQMTPLVLAASLDDPAVVGALLRGGAKPDLRWSVYGDRLAMQEAIEARVYGRFSLHQAEIVQMLLASGADANVRWCRLGSRDNDRYWGPCTSDAGTTPLIAASTEGLSSVTTLLIKAGANPKATDWRGFTALEVAKDLETYSVLLTHAFSSEAAAVQTLIRTRANATSPTARLQRALFDRRYGESRLLLASGVDPNARGGRDGRQTMLGLAVQSGWVDGVRLLLDYRADSNGRSCPDEIVNWRGSEVAVGEECDTTNGMTPAMLLARRPWLSAGPMFHWFRDEGQKDWQGRTAEDHARDAPGFVVFPGSVAAGVLNGKRTPPSPVRR